MAVENPLAADGCTYGPPCWPGTSTTARPPIMLRPLVLFCEIESSFLQEDAFMRPLHGVQFKHSVPVYTGHFTMQYECECCRFTVNVHLLARVDIVALSFFPSLAQMVLHSLVSSLIGCVAGYGQLRTHTVHSFKMHVVSNNPLLPFTQSNFIL